MNRSFDDNRDNQEMRESFNIGQVHAPPRFLMIEENTNTSPIKLPSQRSPRAADTLKRNFLMDKPMYANESKKDNKVDSIINRVADSLIETRVVKQEERL